MERDFTKKESYYLFQSYWADKPMVHIYGHSWPVRWGKEGEPRIIKVYSNCDHAELFLNGKSKGTMQRDSQNFPAAGLRWMVAFSKGPNRIHVIATKGTVTVTDEIELSYQTEPWSKPADLRLREIDRKDGIVTVQVSVYDASGIPCLDSRDTIRFSVAGEGKLIDNLGTTRASRDLQLINGRAEISLTRKGACTLGVASEGLPTALLNL